MTEPKSAPLPQRKGSAKDRAAEAERIYDAPDRREVAEADQKMDQERTKPSHPKGGTPIDRTRKPI